ncbi:MAG: transforming growth factor-beta-induced protein [Marivirga sp.]|jgi:transforming growth factor-beta-induced protein
MVPFKLFFVGCDDDVNIDDIEQEMYPTLVEAAQSAGLTTLLEAVGVVDGLSTILLDAEAIIVFAPSNVAFAGVLEDFGVSDLNRLVEALSVVDQLEIVFKYHVDAAAVFAGDLNEEQTVNTLAGGSLAIRSVDGAVTITDGAGQTINLMTF